jgi:hypothetical protein
MSNVQHKSTEKKGSPLGPLIGFIMFIVIGGLSYVISPAVVHYAETAHVTFGSFGWKLLPIAFPAGWPDILKNLIVTGLLFLILFVVAMIILFSIMKPARGEMDIGLEQIRAQKAKKKKAR